MKTSVLTGTLALALAVASPFATQAKTKELLPNPAMPHGMTNPAYPGQAATKAERPLPFHGKIGSVDAYGKKFTLSSKEGMGRTFRVTGTTAILKEGTPGRFSDLAAGEEIRGSYWKRADGSLEAKSLKVGPPTVAERQAKEQVKARAKQKAAEKAAEKTPKGTLPR